MQIEQDFIKDVDKLLPCPRTALDVMAIANEPDCNMVKLADKIEQDPFLTANMLRFANSAYFGHMKKIHSVSDIVVRLGLEAVKLISIAAASVGLLKEAGQDAYGLDTGHLARHSFATAVLASIIGRNAGAREIDALFTAALLHDVGKIVLNGPLRQALYDSPSPVERPTLLELERGLLHTDHARVGMVLLRQWGLSDKTTVPVGLHHTLDHPRSKFLFCRIVFLANHLAEEVGIHAVDPAEQFFDVKAYTETHGELPMVPGFEENMEGIMAEFHDTFQEMASTFVL